MTKQPRREPLVRLDKNHVRSGLFLGLFVAVGYTIVDVADHGFALRVALVNLAYAVVMVAGMIWASWHEDNRLERELRAERRPFRASAKPKAR